MTLATAKACRGRWRNKRSLKDEPEEAASVSASTAFQWLQAATEAELCDTVDHGAVSSTSQGGEVSCKTGESNAAVWIRASSGPQHWQATKSVKAGAKVSAKSRAKSKPKAKVKAKPVGSAGNGSVAKAYSIAIGSPRSASPAHSSVFRECEVKEPPGTQEIDTRWCPGQSKRSRSKGRVASDSHVGSEMRVCHLCQKPSTNGAYDWLRRKHWYCIACGSEALNQYPEEHREAANHLGFLRECAAQNPADVHSHCSSFSFADPMGFISKFNFPCDDKDAMCKYCEAVAFFYRHQTPLFHIEIFGKGPRVYCEAIHILCKDGPAQQECVLTDAFISIRMAIMADIYPKVEPLQLHVFRSSGTSRKYGQWKISVHLVWPQLIVDDTRATSLRQHCVETLEMLSSHDRPIPESINPTLASSRELLANIADVHLQLDSQQRNTWKRIFVPAVRHLRVPLSNKQHRSEHGSMDEHRPKEPIGTWQFNRVSNRATCCVMRHQVPDSAWVRLGLCRRTSTTALTPWHPPSQRPLEKNRRESADDAAGLGRRVYTPASKNISGTEDKHLVLPRSSRSPQANAAEQILSVWHDGSRGDHGIAAAVTISISGAGASDSQVISSGHMFIPGNFTPACSEYLSFLLGARELSRHIDAIGSRRIFFIGDSKLIQKQMSGSSPRRIADSDHLLPLIKAGRDLMEKIAHAAKNDVELHVLNRGYLASVDKAAKASLRNRTSSMNDLFVSKLFNEVQAMWRVHSELLMNKDQLLNIIEGGSRYVVRSKAISIAASSQSVYTPGNAAGKTDLALGDVFSLHDTN